MPQMSSTYATFHAKRYSINALQNPSPEIPLVKLGNGHTETLRTPAEIFKKANPPAVPPRVPVRGAYQEKLQQVIQYITQMEIAYQ